jgi:hypothetical protein
MDHPPYSPELAPCNSRLFPKYKKMPWRDKDLLPFLTWDETWRYCEVFWEIIFKTVSGSGTIVSWKA